MPDVLQWLFAGLVLYLLWLVSGEDERIADELTDEKKDCK